MRYWSSNLSDETNPRPQRHFALPYVHGPTCLPGTTNYLGVILKSHGHLSLPDSCKRIINLNCSHLQQISVQIRRGMVMKCTSSQYYKNVLSLLLLLLTTDLEKATATTQLQPLPSIQDVTDRTSKACLTDASVCARSSECCSKYSCIKGLCMSTNELHDHRKLKSHKKKKKSHTKSHSSRSSKTNCFRRHQKCKTSKQCCKTNVCVFEKCQRCIKRRRRCGYDTQCCSGTCKKGNCT